MSVLSEIFGLSFQEYDDWEIRLASGQIDWIWILIGVLVPVAMWFFWTSLSRLSSLGKKLFLLTLRGIAFGLLLLVLLQPELEFKKGHLLKNSIAVLFDNSKSLSIKSFPSEKQRIDLVRTTFEKNQTYFKNLKKQFQVDYYFISDHIQPVQESEIVKRYQARGNHTQLDEVLVEVRRQYQDKSLQGVLLFSDGADLGQESQAISPEFSEMLTRFGSPVHTFQAGTNENFRDLAVEHLDYAEFGFVNQPVRLSVILSASSMGEKRVPLVLKEGDKILVSKIVDIRSGQTHYPVELEFTPKTVGKSVYSLSVPLFAGESIAENNRREFLVNVVRDRIRVLHLNGRPSWDSRFLREVLINNPKVDLLSFFILRTLSDDVSATTGELSLIPFPTNLLFSGYLDSFDLVIFQNFKYSPFIEKKYLENIKKYVYKGGAFLMVGGNLSFQSGDFAGTSVEEILPVRMRKGPRNIIHDKFTIQFRNNFAHHPIMRLEKNPDRNQAAWRSLPKLEGLNIGLIPQKGSQVLADFEKNIGNVSSQPVLVVGQRGKGRSMVLATDSTWNWNFLRVGQGGSGRYYQKFWNNVINWLTKDEETERLQISTDKETYQENEKALIKFKLMKEDYNPHPGQTVELTLHSITHKRQVETHSLQTDKEGEGTFEFVPDKPGFYSARLLSKDESHAISREVRFGVFSETEEFRKPLINEVLLQNIARITGGVHAVLGENTDLSGHQFSNPEVIVKTQSKTFSLWDSWWSYSLIVGILFVDWWVRRKSGLS